MFTFHKPINNNYLIIFHGCNNRSFCLSSLPYHRSHMTNGINFYDKKKTNNAIYTMFWCSGIKWGIMKNVNVSTTNCYFRQIKKLEWQWFIDWLKQNNFRFHIPFWKSSFKPFQIGIHLIHSHVKRHANVIFYICIFLKVFLCNTMFMNIF